MEARDRVSALGCDGPLRIRRTPVCILSAGFMGHWRSAERDLSVDVRRRYLHLDGAGGGGYFDVYASPAVAAASPCHHRGCVLRSQSLSSGDRVLAQRLRRIVGELRVAAVAAVSAKSGGGEAACDRPARAAAGRRVADQRAGRRDDPLLVRLTRRRAGLAAPISAASAGGGRGGRAGGTPCGFHPDARDLRTTLGQYYGSGFDRLPAAG